VRFTAGAGNSCPGTTWGPAPAHKHKLFLLPPINTASSFLPLLALQELPSNCNSTSHSNIIMLARSLTRSSLARSVVVPTTRRTAPALLRSVSQKSTATATPAPATNNSAKSAFGVRSFSTTMSAHAIPAPAADNTRPAVDKVVQDIADYVHDYEITSPLAVRIPSRVNCLPLFGEMQLFGYLGC
jgi:hypothetical protein